MRAGPVCLLRARIAQSHRTRMQGSHPNRLWYCASNSIGSGPQFSKARLTLERDVARVAAPAKDLVERLGLGAHILVLIIICALALAPPELRALERGALHALEGSVVDLAEAFLGLDRGSTTRAPSTPKRIS